MRNAALPQRATVELEFNFHKRMRMRKLRNPSSRTVPRHENFECALRLRMPTGWGRGLCQQRGTASEWPAVICARAPEARAACRYHTRLPIRSARDGAPSLPPSPPTPRVASPTSRTSTAGTQAVAAVRGGAGGAAAAMGAFRRMLEALGLRKKKRSVIVLGLPNAGKTSVVAALDPERLEANAEVTPTVGFRCDSHEAREVAGVFERAAVCTGARSVSPSPPPPPSSLSAFAPSCRRVRELA